VIQEGGVANVGAPIAYVAESDADLQEAKSKAGGASNGNGAAPAEKEVPKAEVAKVEAPVAAKSEAAPAPPAPAPAHATSAPAPEKRADGRIIATPYAKKLAKELGVDLNSLAGSGPAGRITASDVEGFKKGGNGAANSPPPAPATPSAAPAPSAQAPPAAAAPSQPAPVSTSVSELKGTTEPFNALQAAVAKNMIESLKVCTLQTIFPTYNHVSILTPPTE